MRLCFWLAVGATLTSCKKDEPEEISSEVQTEEDDLCGDGELNDDEVCDEGADNNADGHCLPDCSLNLDWTLQLGGEELAEAGVDGIATDAEAEFGSGSWRATPSEDTNSDGADKFELFVDPTMEDMELLGAMTLADIGRISYSTLKSEDGGGADFYLVIYTEPDGVEDQSIWYGYRLIAEPLYSQDLDAPADAWNSWSTDPGPNQLTFFDSENCGSFGFLPDQPTLSELQSGTIDWSLLTATGLQTSIDYSSEQIKYLSIQTGSPWESTFDGYIDTVQVVHANGNRVTFDLEP